MQAFKREIQSSSIEFVELRRHRPDCSWTYAQLDQRQREIARRVEQGGPGALLISEVAPVITWGKRTPASDLLLSDQDFLQRGMSLYPTDRGGLATYHGPGQWVIFPIDRLERLTGDSRGVRRVAQALLEAALEVGMFYDSSAGIRSGGETGVWNSHGKFASVGICIQRGIVFHGLSINGFRTSTSFQGLRPCGMNQPMSYLLECDEEECDQERSFELLRARIQEAILKRLW